MITDIIRNIPPRKALPPKGDKTALGLPIGKQWTLNCNGDDLTARGAGDIDITLSPVNDSMAEVLNAWNGDGETVTRAAAAAAGAASPLRRRARHRVATRSETALDRRCRRRNARCGHHVPRPDRQEPEGSPLVLHHRRYHHDGPRPAGRPDGRMGARLWPADGEFAAFHGEPFDLLLDDAAR